MERNKLTTKTRRAGGPANAPQPDQVAAVQNLQPQIASLRSNIGLLGKTFNVRTQTGFRFAHIVLSLRQHLDRLRNDDDDGTGECDRTPGGRYRLPACLLRKFRSDQPSLTNRKKAMPKLLIVDDNRLHLACAAYCLRKNFLPENVFVATDGRQALEVMEHVVIDAIFVDPKMPVMSGLEMADVVRHVENNLGQREFRTLIVGMLTPKEAHSDDLLTEGLVAGMDRFLIKPLPMHLHAILDAVTVSGSAVEGFRRKAMELQWVSRFPEMQKALFGGGAGSDDSANTAARSPSPTSSPTSPTASSGPDQEERRRAQEASLTVAPDLRDERLMLSLIEKDQRNTVEDIFARERRDDTERMQHATALLRDRIEDLERKLAATTGESKKTMESLHIETIARLEKQAEDQRLQIMKLSVRNRELTQRNEKLEEDMRQIIRHGANNARTIRAAFQFIGKVQQKMERYENQLMAREDRSANLSWQNFYGRHFQGTSARKQIEMPMAAEDYSSSWYHEQMNESHRVAARSNEACASAVVLLGELLDHVHLVRPEMFGAAAAPTSSQPVTPSSSQHQLSPSTQPPSFGALDPSSTSSPGESGDLSSAPPPPPPMPLAQQSTLIGGSGESPSTPALASQHQQQHQQHRSAWKMLQRDIERTIHSLSSLLMQNVKDLTEGTKRNIANYCVRELDLWKRLALYDKDEDTFMSLSPKVQDEIHAIVERMHAVRYCKQMRSASCQTDDFEVPPWVTEETTTWGAGGSAVTSSPRSLAASRRESLAGGGGGGESESSFITEVSLGGASSSFAGSGGAASAAALALAAKEAKDWTFTGLLQKLKPIVTFEGYVPVEVRAKAFSKIVESVFRLERRQLGELGDATKKLIREARHTYRHHDDGDEKARVRLLGDVKANLHFREVLKILNNVTDNFNHIVDAVIVHTLKSIEPSQGSSRQTKERGLALALMEALESGDHQPNHQPIFCPWGEPALTHKIRAGETWDLLEKSYGASQIEMKRMNTDINFDEAPAAGDTMRLPNRPDYIRSKFAAMYHPKTTFSKSGAGQRTARIRADGGGGSGAGSPSFGGAGGGRFGASSVTSGMSGDRISHTNIAPSSFLLPHGSGGRNSRFSRTPSGMDPFSKTPSRLFGAASRATTRAPSTIPPGGGYARKKRASIVTDTILHFSEQAEKVGGTARDRVNARVAASVLHRSKKAGGGGGGRTSGGGGGGGGAASPRRSPSSSSKNNSKRGSPSELTIALPPVVVEGADVGAGGGRESQSDSLSISSGAGAAASTKQQTKPKSISPPPVAAAAAAAAVEIVLTDFSVDVKVLHTEAPKTLRELADEFGVSEAAIKNANPAIRDDQALSAGDEVSVPVAPEFVAQSLTEARDSRLVEAMQKLQEARRAEAAIKQEEESMSALLRRVNSGVAVASGGSPSVASPVDREGSGVTSDSGRSLPELDFAAAMERTRSHQQLAAAAVAESAAAVDHAAALHKALQEQLGLMMSPTGLGSAASPDALEIGSLAASVMGGSMSPTSPAGGASSPAQQDRRVVVDMPVQEATSFEVIAQQLGVRGEDLVSANPTLSNPIAAGSVMRVPINIDEWREGVAQRAADASAAADGSAAGLRQIDSMIIQSERSESFERDAVEDLGIGSGGDLQLQGSGSMALPMLPVPESVWSRDEKALFTSVKAALEQRNLTVTVEHTETEYGVTLGTIALEYACIEEDIAPLNKDNGAIIRDDDDDNSVNPAIPLLVPVPLSSVLRRLADYTMEAQKRCIELSRNVLEQEALESASMMADNENISNIDGNESSVGGGGILGKKTVTLSELAQLEELVHNHLVCIAELLDTYHMRIQEKLTPPESHAIATMTDNVSSILFSSLKATGADSIFHHHHAPHHAGAGASHHGSRRHSVTSQQSTSTKEHDAAADEERQRQLAAAAILLGIDDISQVPDALRNARLSAVATNFLENLRNSYPITSAEQSRRSTVVSSDKLFQQQQQQQQQAQQQAQQQQQQQRSTVQFGGLTFPSQFTGVSPQHNLFGGSSSFAGNRLDGLLVVGKANEAGSPFGGAGGGGAAGGGGRASFGAGSRTFGPGAPGGHPASPSSSLLQQKYAQQQALKSGGGPASNRHDLLRERMARLGFNTSAEALYGNADALSRLHSQAPLVEGVLRVNRVDGGGGGGGGGGDGAHTSPGRMHSTSPQRRRFVEGVDAPPQQPQQDGGGRFNEEIRVSPGRSRPDKIVLQRIHGGDAPTLSPRHGSPSSPSAGHVSQQIWGGSSGRSAAVDAPIVRVAQKQRQQQSHPHQWSPVPPATSLVDARFGNVGGPSPRSGGRGGRSSNDPAKWTGNNSNNRRAAKIYSEDRSENIDKFASRLMSITEEEQRAAASVRRRQQEQQEQQRRKSVVGFSPSPTRGDATEGSPLPTPQQHPQQSLLSTAPTSVRDASM